MMGTVRERLAAVAGVGLLLSGMALRAESPASPSSAERLAARRALERVDYAHLEWPEGSLEPKPSFEELFPEAEDAALVARSLRMASALERLWQERVTPAEIQAEIDRMARDSKRPDRLQEYWAALGNDPLRIAEGLVRPRLTEQRLRDRYAWDASLHGSVRERALAESAGARATGALGGLTAERAQCLYLTAERLGERSPSEGEMLLGDEAWQALRLRLSADGLSGFATRLGPLQESQDSFFAQTATEVQKGSLLVTTYSWPKRPFDAWWEEAGPAFEEACPEGAAYRLPSLPDQPADAHQSWSAISTTGAPSARRKHTAAWNGVRMVVWGGENFSGVAKNDGGQYDPATDSWTATKTTGAPTARSLYRIGVWTGTYLFLWGGNSGSSVLNDGARYSPGNGTGNDSWYTLPTNNAPAGRTEHVAVYSPGMSRVVLWGGGLTATGGETNNGKNLVATGTTWYDQLSTSTMARRRAAAGYDGSAAGTGLGGVVLWGGSSSAYPNGLNSGAVYSVSDGWAATTTTGAPSAREYATGVWRPGFYFIVWGGNSGTTVYGDGARWAPAPTSDVWTTLGTTGAPAARTFHTALWADNQTGMVVWGGQTLVTNSFFADGAVYYPVTQSWTALATTGAPSARSFHSAVYATGTNSDVMFVWGGTNGSAVTNTGGAYHFCRTASVPATTDTITAVDKNSTECTATGVQVTWPQNPNGGWNDDGFGPRSYTVLRGTTEVATVAFPATTAVDSGGTPNTAYTYTVRYTNGCGHTATTAGVSATDATDKTPCADPLLQVAKSGSDAALSWDAIACTDLSSYKVYGSTTYGATFPSGWTLLGSPTGTTATDPQGSSYKAYLVATVDACGNLSAP